MGAAQFLTIYRHYFIASDIGHCANPTQEALLKLTGLEPSKDPPERVV
jgi:hypothetical protein